MRLLCSASRVAIAVALVLSPIGIAAQGAGSIKGTITTADGNAPIAGARASVANPLRSAIADDAGAYTLRDLPAGQYVVTVTAVAHEPMTKSVTVSGGQAATLDVALKKGSIMLSSVMVSASTSPMEARKVAATVNELTPEQVRLSPARETQDLLREIPGVELPRTSSQVGGTAQIVSIRGVDEGRTAVLVDGIPINDAWGEWIDWSRAPKGSIERVEVLEGGGSNLYGNGAMGGVISMFSRPVSPGQIRTTLESGMRNLRHAFASVASPAVGPFTLALTGDYSQGGGYKLIGGNGGPVDVEANSIIRNGMARLEYTPSANVSARVTGHLFGDDRHLGTPKSQTWRTDGSTDAGLNLTRVGGGALSIRAWDREMREHQTSTSLLTVSGTARADERVTAINHIPSYDRGAGVAWTRANVLGFQSVGVGGDWRYMGGFYDEQDYANNAANAKTTHFNSGGNQVLSGLYVNGVLAPSERLGVELSARADNWGNNDGQATDASGVTHYPNANRSAVSPRVGVRYQIAPTLSAHTAFYNAFRAPNLAELYRKSASATAISNPNPELKPEFATGYELGMDWQPSWWMQMKGTIYHTDYRDFNTQVTTSATGVVPSVRQRMNVQKAAGLGGELYIAVRPDDRLTLSASGNLNDTRVTDLGPVAPTPTSFKGARVARVPQQKATARATWNSADLGTWSLIMRYEGTNTTFGNSFTLPEFTVFDASGSWNLMRGVDVFVGAENLFDRAYVTSLSGATTAPILSIGMPFTLRVGFDLYRY